MNPSAQDQLNQLLGKANGTNLIPDSLVSLLTVSFIVANVIGVLFIIAYIFTLIRKWKVQSAVLHMQKDIAEIKSLLSSSKSPAEELAPPESPVSHDIDANPDRQRSESN
jgi:hypothetical protein